MITPMKHEKIFLHANSELCSSRVALFQANFHLLLFYFLDEYSLLFVILDDCLMLFITLDNYSIILLVF